MEEWEVASASHCSEHTYSDPSWRCLPQPGTKRRGEGILRMEDAGTSEEDDIEGQDSNTPIEHGHLARNCTIKIWKTPRCKTMITSVGCPFASSMLSSASSNIILIWISLFRWLSCSGKVIFVVRMLLILVTPLIFFSRRAGSDGSMSASASAGPGFNPRRGSKF